MSDLALVPLTLKQLKEFVAEHHRHNQPPVGWKFGVGIEKDNVLVGVAGAGRPVARMLDDGYTLEVIRSCIAGEVPNGNSRLYAAIKRAAWALGYRRLVTYTLESESGSSLKACGFRDDGLTGGGEWSRPSRKRKAGSVVGYDTGRKRRWVMYR